jgi:hypothetical protein
MNGQLLIDINELSRRIGISKGTLCQWVYLRRMPFIKGAAPCVSAVKSKAGRPPYGAAWPARSCAPQSPSAMASGSGAAGTGGRIATASPPVTLMTTGKRFQIDDGF